MNRQSLLAHCLGAQLILGAMTGAAFAEDWAKEAERLSREYPVSVPCPTQAMSAGISAVPKGWSPTGIGLVLHQASATTGRVGNGPEQTELDCHYNDQLHPDVPVQFLLRRFVSPASCIVGPDQKGFRCKPGTPQ
jgi:hypothetical protein